MIILNYFSGYLWLVVVIWYSDRTRSGSAATCLQRVGTADVKSICRFATLRECDQNVAAILLKQT